MTIGMTAQALLSAAESLAAIRRQRLSGAHVLCCAFRQPFPGLAKVLAQAELTPHALGDELESLLAGGTGDAPAGAVREIIEATKTGAAGQELTAADVFVAALGEDGKAVQAFRSLLQDVEPGLLERLEQLAGSRDNVDADLRADRIGPRVVALLNRAQLLAKGRPISTGHVLRVWISDRTSLLAKGLFAVDGYERFTAALGGYADLPNPPKRAVDLERCAEYLRVLLQAALVKAVENGVELIDERSLALAFLDAAAVDPASDFESIARLVPRLRSWIVNQRQTPAEVEGSGEIPIDQIVPFLESRLINQSHAIAEVYGPILRVRLDLGFDDALAAVLLFVGPPGVGKSYLAKLMAEALYGRDPENPEAHVVMVECGRYKDSHAVTDLIGAPHGYVGSDKGILRDGVRDKAPCVIIFDEAERMNLQIWDSLLTMLNDGVFRDNEGARYTLRNCVVVLTSNKGIEEAEDYRKKISMGLFDQASEIVKEADKRLEDSARGARGKGSRQMLSFDDFWTNSEYRENYKAILLSRVKEHFGPAMFSRINAKIGFNGLRGEDYVKIATNAIRALTEHLKNRTGVILWPGTGVSEAIANLARTKESADARLVAYFVRQMILDEAFAPLKLNHIKDGTPLAAAYQIKAVMAGRGEARKLERFDLEPGDPPSSASP